MDVPNRILVDFPSSYSPKGIYGRISDDDFSDDEYQPPKIQVNPAVNLMSPPKTLTALDIGEEERRRYMRDTSMNASNINYTADDSIYRTPVSDSLLKNIASDPIGVARQVRHLHNRVRLLEEELQAQHNRQVFMIGFVSLYFITRCFRWLYK